MKIFRCEYLLHKRACGFSIRFSFSCFEVLSSNFQFDYLTLKHPVFNILFIWFPLTVNNTELFGKIFIYIFSKHFEYNGPKTPMVLIINNIFTGFQPNNFVNKNIIFGHYVTFTAATYKGPNSYLPPPFSFWMLW